MFKWLSKIFNKKKSNIVICDNEVYKIKSMQKFYLIEFNDTKETSWVTDFELENINKKYNI